MGFGKDGQGAIVMENRSQSLGTLAANTGIFIGTKLAITEDFRMLKSVVHCLIDNLTSFEGFGLCLYLVDGDLTLAEAEAKIDGTNGPLSSHDRVGSEVVERFVKLCGAMSADGGDVDHPIDDMNTGAPIVVVKPRWTFGEASSWNWLLYNRAGSALTTGATVKINAENFGVWIH